VIVKRRNRHNRIRYGVRVHRGSDRHEWVGTFDTLGEAREAEREALSKRRRSRVPTCEEYAAFYLEGYERRVKASSYDKAREALRFFRRDFGPVRLDDVTPVEAERWARENNWRVPQVAAMFNDAVRKRVIDFSSFRSLYRSGEGRRRITILTDAELERFASCAEHAHGAYGPQMRGLVLFLAYTTIRPGEAFALEWADIDFDAHRIHVRRRAYKGRTDLPKSNRAREIVLPPPARDALLGLPRDRPHVFRNKRGDRLRQETLSRYWDLVEARFGRELQPYELRHFGAHYLYVRLGLPSRVVAAQMGHSNPRLVEDLYGHGDVGALE